MSIFDRNPCAIDGVRFANVDMSDPKAIAEAVSALEGQFDVLLNIAGLPPRDGNEALLYDVNFFALRQLTGLMHERLNDEAAIVNVASFAGNQWAKNIDEVR